MDFLLNKNYLIHYVKVFTGVFVATPGSSFRIGTLLILAFDLVKGSLKSVLGLFKVVLQEEAIFAKVAVKLMVEDSA